MLFGKFRSLNLQQAACNLAMAVSKPFVLAWNAAEERDQGPERFLAV